MKRQEYHEIYGFLPKEIINKLSESDKMMLFTQWVLRKPTETGWFITRAVVDALGDRFVNYILCGVVEALEEDGACINEKNLINLTYTMMERFASDPNTLEEYVRIYREEVLGINDDLDDSDDTREEVKPVKKMPKRDAKGRFVKTK